MQSIEQVGCAPRSKRARRLALIDAGPAETLNLLSPLSPTIPIQLHGLMPSSLVRQTPVLLGGLQQSLAAVVD